MTIELACCTRTLLDTIADRSTKQRDVAVVYSLAMASSEPTDWGAVNRAIIERWSMAGLARVKDQAWKLAKEMSAAESEG